MITKALFDFENNCLNLDKYKNVSYLGIGDSRLVDYIRKENVEITKVKSPVCYDVCWGLSNTVTVSYYDARNLLATLIAVTVDKCNCLNLYDYFVDFQEEMKPSNPLDDEGMIELRAFSNSLNSSEVVMTDSIIKDHRNLVIALFKMLEEFQPNLMIRKFSSESFQPDNEFYYYVKVVEVVTSYVKGGDFIVNPNGNYCSGMFPIKKGYNSNCVLKEEDVRGVSRTLTDYKPFSDVDELWESGNNSVLFSIVYLEMIGKLLEEVCS